MIRFRSRSTAVVVAMLAAMFLWAAPVLSQDSDSRQSESDSEAVDSRFNSPRATMFTFLDAMGRGDADLAVRALDLSPAQRAAGREIAARLLEVLNRAGRVTPAELPDRAAVRAQGLSSFVYFPRDTPRHRRMAEAAPGGEISLMRADDGRWLFSERTVATIDDLWRKTDRFDALVHTGAPTIAMRVRSAIPASLRQGEFIGVEHWQWIGLALIVFIAVVIDFTVRFIVRLGAIRWAERRGGKAEPETLNRLVRPFGLFAGALFALATIWTLGLPPTALSALLVAIRLILMVSGVWAAFRVTDLISDVFASRAAQTRTKFDDLLVPLVRKTAKVLIFAMGLVYIANSLHIEILPLLTGLGIGGLAVAFAAKDTIENFFGSIAVIVDRPFEVGDWVVINDVEGTVEELGFRSTRIRTFYNSQVTVPNAALVRATVDNYGRRKFRRYSTTIGVAYNTDPDAIEAFCAGVRELIRMHPHTRKDFYHVWLNEYGASSLNILVYIFFQTPDWATELRERHRFILDTLRLARRLKIEIAFPTRTLYLRRDQDPEQLPPMDGNEQDASRLGAEAAYDVTANASWRTQPPGPVLFDGEAIDETRDREKKSQVDSRSGGG